MGHSVPENAARGRDLDRFARLFYNSGGGAASESRKFGEMGEKIVISHWFAKISKNTMRTKLPR